MVDWIVGDSDDWSGVFGGYMGFILDRGIAIAVVFFLLVFRF